jgi:hypothetical protein
MEDQDYYYSNYTILNHILDEDIAQIEKNIRERTGQTPIWST